MNKKDIILFVSIFCVLSLIVGGTYAYWQWESGGIGGNQAVVFNTVKDIDDYIYYDGGVSKFVGNFEPSGGHCGGKGNTIEFYVKSSAPDEMKEAGILTATIKMDVNNISSAISSSGYVKWAVTEDSEGACGKLKNSGTLSSVGTIDLLSDIVISTSSSKYTVWVWVDAVIFTIPDPEQQPGDLNYPNRTMFDRLNGETADVNLWTQIDMSSAD